MSLRGKPHFILYKHIPYKINYAATELLYIQSQTVKKSISLFLEWFSELAPNIIACSKEVHCILNFICYELELSSFSLIWIHWNATNFSGASGRQQEFTELEPKMSSLPGNLYYKCFPMWISSAPSTSGEVCYSKSTEAVVWISPSLNERKNAFRLGLFQK